MLPVAVLISGRGSNLLAIHEACERRAIDARIVTVLTDRPGALGLDRARERGLDAAAVPLADYRDRTGRLDRTAFESELDARIVASGAQLIVLAGFMRVLGAQFVARHIGRIVNIHPSLLPVYKGLHTHQRALAAGDAFHGASVHFVTAELDGGPVIVQAKVPVLPGDSPTTLSDRVQAREHIIYPKVIGWIAEGRLKCVGGKPIMDGQPLSEPLQL